jgi:DMSO/TMAO reductase YedYZ molybdopterin-dependent catalytic subunit
MGAEVVYASKFPKTLEYIGLDSFSDPTLTGKDGRLIVLNDKPINAETPPDLLDPELTPNDLFFVRNNGIPPVNVDVNNWTLTIEGESARTKKTYTLKELKTKFKEYTYRLTLECGGNGRKEFNPPAKGNQWGLGAVGCAAFTGVRLKDILEDVGVKSDAVYIGYYGRDAHLSGDPNKSPISRGVPMSKAMEDETLIAWAMNGDNIPELNGYPLRLVVGGWPASCSGKWLSKIVIRNKVHDGTKMTGQAYRLPCNPVGPGTKVADEDMCIIESMPVKSLLTYPKTGAMINLSETLPIRGHAWAGDFEVKTVDYSIDFGATWTTCNVTKPKNRFAWQQFSANIKFPKKGYYEVWAKATDSEDNSQPMILPGWNPKGYLNNACHRIAIKVE